MTALANENGVVPAQDDANNALAASSVGADELPRLPDGETDTEFHELKYRERCAEAKEAALAQARKLAMVTGDWAAYEAIRDNQDRDDSDVTYSERGRDTRHGVREPWLLYGLKTKRNWLSPDDAAIYKHRLEVSDALFETGHPGAEGRLFLPGFSAMAREEFTGWRPWNVDLFKPQFNSPDHPMWSQRLAALQKKKRFDAILDQIAGEHADRHWFYAHPFCSECFPTDVVPVDGYLAGWFLRHGENRFPAYEWDGAVPPMPTIADEIQFLTDEDLAERPETRWLVGGVLPDAGTGLLRARDQSFKSFMALDWALQVVMDGGKVLYCVGEGVNQFSKRRDAWMEHNGCALDDLEGRLHYADRVPNLFTGDTAFEAVLARARREQYDLVIIDTYARAAAGSDINSQGDQGVVTARVDEIKRATDGTVLLVAHSQKSDTDASGSIEIEDARDFVFSMKRHGTSTTVTFEVTKQKDGVESPKPATFEATPVGPSMVLVPVDGSARAESIMSTKDWIVAALSDTSALGPRTEAEILRWINDHEHRRTMLPLKRGTLSSALSREVGVTVTKTGTRYLLTESS